MVILHSPTKGSHKPPNKEQSDHDLPLRVGPPTKQLPVVAPPWIPAADATMANAPLRVADLPATIAATKTLILAMTSQPKVLNVNTIHDDDTMGTSNCSPQPAQPVATSCKTHSMHQPHWSPHHVATMAMQPQDAPAADKSALNGNTFNPDTGELA